MPQGQSTKTVKALVRERDEHRCVDCGRLPKAGRKLAVHRLAPNSRYTVDGCVAVCQSCHAKRHAIINAEAIARGESPPATVHQVRGVGVLCIRCGDQLKNLAGEAADRAGVPLSEWVARVLAAHFGRPELGKIPRKPIGRPRTKAVAS